MPPLSPVTEHQNYFGIDENLGPVAVSIRREKVEDAKEKEGSQFNYRVAFRTSEVMAALCPYGPEAGAVTALGSFRYYIILMIIVFKIIEKAYSIFSK